MNLIPFPHFTSPPSLACPITTRLILSDYTVPVPGHPLLWVRTYNSKQILISPSPHFAIHPGEVGEPLSGGTGSIPYQVRGISILVGEVLFRRGDILVHPFRIITSSFSRLTYAYFAPRPEVVSFPKDVLGDLYVCGIC